MREREGERERERVLGPGPVVEYLEVLRHSMRGRWEKQVVPKETFIITLQYGTSS